MFDFPIGPQVNVLRIFTPDTIEDALFFTYTPYLASEDPIRIAYYNDHMQEVEVMTQFTVSPTALNFLHREAGWYKFAAPATITVRGEIRRIIGGDSLCFRYKSVKKNLLPGS